MGEISGLFIYEDTEKTGTIYTRSRQVFDYFYDLRPFDSLFAEMPTEHVNEPYDIYTIDLGNFPIAHSFSYPIAAVQGNKLHELEQFMVSAYPRMNRKWATVALSNGDKCFIVRLGEEIAGAGWLSFVNRIGRLHTLYVRPQFRGIGIGEDILFARLLWLKSKNARFAFSEISRFNYACSKIAMQGNMKVSGQVFRYFNNKERRTPSA